MTNPLPVIEPLVAAFDVAGISYWYDKAEIKWGDSLTGKVAEGLATSRYVIVVVSKSSTGKRWPQKELNVALNKEITSGTTCVLPLMVGTKEEVEGFQAQLPLQADKLYLTWDGSPEAIVRELKKLLETGKC